MLLIGFRNINTTTGNTEDSLGHVTHQRVDIIADSHIYNTHTLRELYFSMLERAEESSKKLQKLREDLEFIDMSIDEFEKLENELLGHMQILKYDKVIVAEGSVLK